jgi:hypothetical protein
VIVKGDSYHVIFVSCIDQQSDNNISKHTANSLISRLCLYCMMRDRYVPPPPVSEVRSSAATKAAERRARSATNKAAAIAAAAALSGIASSRGGAIASLPSQDDKNASASASVLLTQEPVVQYTYDSIGRRRPIKPSTAGGSRSNNKRLGNIMRCDVMICDAM